MPQHRPQRNKPSLLAWLIHIIRVVKNYVLHKQDARNTSHELAEHALPASIRRELVNELFAELQAAAISTGGIEVTLTSTADEPSAEVNRTFSDAASAGSPTMDDVHSDQERALIHRIHHETEIANRNNVTRTEAYRAVYYRSPELQWALLAHLVSRNGGWNMTDLQGDLLPELMDEETRRHTFVLLERINSLIFHDAYPQLLLYE